MNRNKSPGINRKGNVSSNDTASTGGSSGHSGPQGPPLQGPPAGFLPGSSAGSLPGPPLQGSSPPASNSTPSKHGHNQTQGSLNAHHLIKASSSSVEDHLNDESSNNEVSPNLYTNGSTLDSNPNNNMVISTSRDDLDALLPHSADAQRIRAATKHFHSKIIRTKEAIKEEQNARDENVNEYLKLASNADKNQLQRIKSVFEKKNQKSAQTIANLQKKLDSYNKKIKEIETRGLHGVHHRQTREMLRDVGQGLKDVGVNIKEGITGLSGGVIGGIKSGISAAAHTAGETVTVMSKPREFFKNRFGSAENITSLEKSNPEEYIHPQTSNIDETGECGNKTVLNQTSSNVGHSHSHSTKYTSEDESSSITSGSGPGHLAAGIIPSLGGSSASPARKHMIVQGGHIAVTETAATPTAMIDIEPLVAELRERREECQRLSEDMESLKSHFQNECTVFHQSLQEERYRFERLEEQMNDLIELHQNEIENLKQGIVDMEEKVQYQSEERLRDVQEMLESCQTRISRMEHQQHQHLQQLVNLDSLENSNARALVLKLINVVLTILQVVLLLVATIANILAPFLQTRVRIVTSIIVLSTIMLICQQWPEFGAWTRSKISENWFHFSSVLDHG